MGVMHHYSRLCLLIAILSLTLLCTTTLNAHDSNINVIKFGIFPYKSPRTLIELFAPIAKRIEKQTGQKVKLVSAPDYATFVERGKQGEYDLLFPCVSCFFQIQSAGYHIIARGEPSFHGSVIVHNDSDIVSLEQLKGKKIAAIGKHSYAGYLFLKQQMGELQISVDSESDIHFLKKNDSIIFGVVNKQFDAGIIRVDSLSSPQFSSVRDTLRVLSLSPDIPQFPFAVRNNMDSKTEAAIQDVLTGINPENQDDLAVLQDLRIQKISVAQDSDYDSFREILSRFLNFDEK